MNLLSYVLLLNTEVCLRTLHKVHCLPPGEATLKVSHVSQPLTMPETPAHLPKKKHPINTLAMEVFGAHI